MDNDITIIIVGKNEEKILDKCFSSALTLTNNIIYVDSDSTDSSIEIAKSYNKIKIISLKTENYFHTASLARSIAAKEVKTKFIQFIDADMTIESEWIKIAKKRLNNDPLLAAAVGYKKDYTSIESNIYTLRKDSKEFYPDYLGGAFLIKKKQYDLAGGFDPLVPWDEERDLYLRILKNKKKVIYLDVLMASHFDYKTKSRGILFILLNEKHKCFWRIIGKVFSDYNFGSYIFVYRKAIPFLIADLTSLYFLTSFELINMILAQIIALIYGILINRRGLIFYWKSILLSSVYLFFPKKKKLKIKFL
jgi:glycosyltransferase involved in cell wall biosynthesis